MGRHASLLGYPCSRAGTAKATSAEAGALTSPWPRIEAAPEILDDFDRIFDHLAQSDVAAAPSRIEEILQAVQVLASSPLIGRQVKAGKRELVIGRGSRGYVALYRYVPEVDTVFVLAIRSQREAGYQRGA